MRRLHVTSTFSKLMATPAMSEDTQATWTRPEIAAKVIGIILGHVRRPCQGLVTEASRIPDGLPVDSIDVVNIELACEAAFRVTIDAFETFGTVGDLVSAIHDTLKTQGRA